MELYLYDYRVRAGIIHIEAAALLTLGLRH